MLLNACLVLLLVSVSVQYSYGIDEICKQDSDCTYEHSICYKFDQCDSGSCQCQTDYAGDKCSKRWKKIGESCSGQNDVCLFSSCKYGFCKCDSNDLPSKINMICGRMYGEECPTGSDNCIDGLSCLDSKCVCENDKKNYNVSMTNPFGLWYSMCLNSFQNVNRKASQPCDDIQNLCENGLTCAMCPGINDKMICVSGPKLWEDNPTVKPTDSSGSNSIAVDIRLNGASQLSVGLLALCGLLVTAVLTKFF